MFRRSDVPSSSFGIGISLVYVHTLYKHKHSFEVCRYITIYNSGLCLTSYFRS